MKILHVNYLPSNIVIKEKKIQEMAGVAKRENLPIHFLVLNDTVDRVESNIEYRKIGLPINGKLKKVFQMLFRYLYLLKHLKGEHFDIMVLRYPLAMGIGANKFFKKYGHKTYTEHHTNEVVELRRISKNVLFGLVVSKWEHWRKKKYLSQCLGVIGVTSEISKYEQSFTKNKPFFTFPNGADIQAIPYSGAARKEKNVLRLLFVAGRFAPWHGLDRVLKGLESYDGSGKLILILVGNLNKISNADRIMHNVNRNVKIETHGQLQEPELTEIASKAHVAISSLGIHRVGLDEASVLKTREYMARGIPFIYSYQDSDLSGGEPFAYKFPNDNTPIDFDEVNKFYESYMDDSEISVNMRAQAEETLDWSVKLEKLITFIKEN